MAFDIDFRKGIAGIIFNPVGYMAQHKPLADVVGDYYRNHQPGKQIDAKNTTEEGFKVRRQQWVDGCASSAKSTDVGYSLANASRACGEVFDQDPISTTVQNTIATRAGEEQKSIMLQIGENQRKAIIMIILLLAVGIALYLLVSN